MKSYWGVSHLDYPNDRQGYINAISSREIWPMIGLIIPLCTMLFTRGFDITWHSGQVPPMWCVGILLISGFGGPLLNFFHRYLMHKMRKILNTKKEDGLHEMLPKIYQVNSSGIWDLYYLIKYVMDTTIFLIAITVGWGFSSIIYFAIGRV